MNKRKYRDELIRMRRMDAKRVEEFMKQFKYIIELLALRLEPIRPMEPINISPAVFEKKISELEPKQI